MIPWHKLSKESQQAILALIVMSGGAATTRCCPPMICDPAPPPRTATPRPPSPIICDPAPPPSITPTRSRTPIICDPPPPPRVTPTPTRSPVICDPPPPPALTRTITPALQSRFQLRSLQMTTDTTLKGAAVRGNVFDAQGQPLGDVKITVQTTGTVIGTATARNGSFFIRVPDPGSYTLIIGDDKSSALPLQLKQFDVANVEWVELSSQSQLSLPLAEIRSVDIVWGDDLTFAADSPWAGAHYRWSVSGGKLIQENDRVTWVPPTAPGRYLLQLIADWSAEGLAVDALTLAVAEDGTIVIC